MTAYDVIGDIHGSGDKLRGLLRSLGWTIEPGTTPEPPADERRAVFVGDLIDRGPDQLAVLELVRSMVDGGVADIVMGNHEFNAIGWATPHRTGNGHMRAHNEKNEQQHRAFLGQLSEPEQRVWVAWFKTLPLWLDLDGLRVVHACWHNESIADLTSVLGGDRLPDDIETIARAHGKGPDGKEDPLHQAAELVLKGPEISLERHGLPCYADEGGQERYHARAAWWRRGAVAVSDLVDIPRHTRTVSGDLYPDLPTRPCYPDERSYAYNDKIPVVYGHHWRRWEPDEHVDWTTYTACVDFSAVIGGPLVAYQWKGETTINPSRFVRFPSAD